jgi:phosphoenolpyruvate carboxylase
MDNSIQNVRKTVRLSKNIVAEIEKIKGSSFSNKLKRLIASSLEQKPLDNADYSELTEALFDLKREIAPIGSNLNQLALFFNQGADCDGIENIDMLDELQGQFKDWMILMKKIEKELRIR